MSITKNVFRLNKVYDLIVDGQIVYDASNDPAELYMWGANAGGQIGDNTVIPRSSPVQIPGTEWNKGVSTYNFSLARKTDNSLWAWGSNSVYGPLGQNDTTPRSSPVQIPGTLWSSSSNGNCFAIALKADNTLWVWGSNLCGNLGQNNTTPRSSPIQIPGTAWCAVEVGGGGNSGFGIKTDGTLWGWGNNSSGSLGVNSSIGRFSSPVQIPGTQWQEIFGARGDGFFARKTDGTLWTWGANNVGQLGDNSTGDKSSPIQIPGNWVRTCRGGSTSVGLKTDGTLWTWGRGSYGALGVNSIIHRSSPTQIPGSSWKDIAFGSFHGVATKIDGTLWSWGYNTCGRLGDNSVIHRSSPVQIPGNWLNPIADGSTSGAMKSS